MRTLWSGKLRHTELRQSFGEMRIPVPESQSLYLLGVWPGKAIHTQAHGPSWCSCLDSLGDVPEWEGGSLLPSCSREDGAL